MAAISRCAVLAALAVAAPAAADDWWIEPVERVALRAAVVHEAERTYSVAARPRDVAGRLALSCAYEEGRPCGDGVGVDGELDSVAGYGAWLSAGLRLRLRSGRGEYGTGADVDRAHLGAALGPLAIEAGRDVLALGPDARTQAGWGRNAPPLDHIRLALAGRVAGLDVRAAYALGRLAAPQTYAGTLVSIARLELGLPGGVELGAMQLLQLGGAGAPGFGPIDFVLEHVRRRDASASPDDSSNRRFGVDATLRLGDARLSYQAMFEDLRAQVLSALRHDTDHVVGVTTPWLAVELRQTGARAYEHRPRVTGFTSAGRIVGDPLGPAATAAFVGGRLARAWGDLLPWLEAARLDSDSYSFDDGPVARTAAGPSELRVRVGVGALIPLRRGLALAPELAVEDVERAAYVPGARRVNALARAALIWRPAR